MDLGGTIEITAMIRMRFLVGNLSTESKGRVLRIESISPLGYKHVASLALVERAGNALRNVPTGRLPRGGVVAP